MSERYVTEYDELNALFVDVLIFDKFINRPLTYIERNHLRKYINLYKICLNTQSYQKTKEIEAELDEVKATISNSLPLQELLEKWRKQFQWPEGFI